uniref:Uncharacterized protein n=1 Tax=Arundo donax TaxID=35708 RepID=A0A0A9DUD8_ARUDO
MYHNNRWPQHEISIHGIYFLGWNRVMGFRCVWSNMPIPPHQNTQCFVKP